MLVHLSDLELRVAYLIVRYASVLYTFHAEREGKRPPLANSVESASPRTRGRMWFERPRWKVNVVPPMCLRAVKSRSTAIRVTPYKYRRCVDVL